MFEAIGEMNSQQKIIFIKTALEMLHRTGVKYVALKLGVEWWAHFMYVLGATRVSFGDYSHGGRFMQTHGGESTQYQDMTVIVSTAEVPDEIPAGTQEAYAVLGLCPDCGDVVMFFTNCEESANDLREIYGLVTS